METWPSTRTDECAESESLVLGGDIGIERGGGRAQRGALQAGQSVHLLGEQIDKSITEGNVSAHRIQYKMKIRLFSLERFGF